MPYIGKSPSFGVRDRFIYLITTSGATSVSGTDANGATLTFTDGAYVDVYLNGVLLKPTTDYNTSTANTIAGLSALNTNDEVTVVVYDVFTVADMVSATSGGTFSGAVTANSTLDMNGTELILDADADTSITADTDDQIDLRVGGIDTFVVKPDVVEIKGSHPDLKLMDTDDNNYGGLFYNNGAINLASDHDATGATGKINFVVDGSTKASIIADGKVGIGTTTPSVNVHIVEDSTEGTPTYAGATHLAVQASASSGDN